MQNLIRQVSILGVFALACGQPAQVVDDVVVEDLGNGVMQLHVASQADQSTAIPDGTPGEDPDVPLVDKARDCSYVEWCNEPGRRGTICRARAACGCSGVIECNEEVRAICGGFIDPAYFLCPGQP
jgi:hypothetical protein